MENYSSKICTKCYSVQEPAARFCDNCGKAFAATAATDGNISMVTKTFLKRQVAETRPLFWLCIIIVGMLGLFGFAQAGLYLTEPAAATASVLPKPVHLVSKDTKDTTEPQTVPVIGEETARPADALDLNDSVFEMGEGSSGSPKTAAHRRSFVSPKVKADHAKTEKAETADTTTPTAEKTEVAPAKPDAPAEPPASKPADTGTSPKKYIRGPMGGCYYISASGSKRYVDRGLCS